MYSKTRINTMELWKRANILRGVMDPVEYMPVILGLLFLRYLSFEESTKIIIPSDAQWSNIVYGAKQSDIGQIIDDAMLSIERENPSMKDALPKYSHLSLEKTHLNEIIYFINEIDDTKLFGYIYDYFLSKFAGIVGQAEAKFHTPCTVNKLLVDILRPYHGKIYDPCCGTGMFIRHLYNNKINLYGQESNYIMWQLAKMNLVINDIDSSQIIHKDSLHDDYYNLKADFILANPPFNDPKCAISEDDKRWVYGVPPNGNANFAWIQHVIYHLSSSGVAGIVLANITMTSNNSNEYKIRKNLIEADLVDCIISLPGQLFHSTQIPSCLWILSRRQNRHVLFIDARNMGKMENPTHRLLSEEEIQKISNTYHAWQSKGYKNMLGFCKSVNLEEIRKQNYTLEPNNYVGMDHDTFKQTMKRLVDSWEKQKSEARRLDDSITENMKRLGFGDSCGS